ncbi:hypothetical protein D3C72_1984630 [compost metagenome]
MFAVFGGVHGAQAVLEGAVVTGRVAKRFKDLAQHVVADLLWPVVGVDPVAGQPYAGGQAV